MIVVYDCFELVRHSICNGDALSITVDDVVRVYDLPRVHDSANDTVAHYTKIVMQAAAKKHGLPGRVKAKGMALQNELKVCFCEKYGNRRAGNIPTVDSGITRASTRYKMIVQENRLETCSLSVTWIFPPSFNLGILQPSIQVADQEVLATIRQHDSVPKIVEKVVPAVRERPKKILKKSHITMTSYCVDDGRKKKMVVRKVPQLPKPPMSTFNSMKNLLINYTTSLVNETLPRDEIIHQRDDLAMTLSRNEFRSLDYDEELVADIVDSYCNLLNLRAMEESEFGPKRWIFRTTLAICFPICDGGHYNMFVVNRRDKRFEFLDSLHPDSFHTKWRRTIDRVVKFAAAYYNFNNHGETFDKYEWVQVKGVKQPSRSKECGIYLRSWAEVWDGVVEEYMTSIWCQRDYYRNIRNSICIALISWEENSAFDTVKVNAFKWSKNRRVIRHGGPRTRD
ncbi:hypothetical protein LINGRAHAP2_LOCUS23508 [Linum grandiflorum]